MTLLQPDEWPAVSLPALISGLLGAAAFCIHALIDSDGFLLLDHVNLPFHEFGHLLFGLLGDAAGIWGGTLMQLAVPLGLCVSFLVRKEPAGVFFTAFWFGENFLNIGVYIGDARTLALPLVGGGEHDWNIILGRLGMLRHDHLLAAVVRAAGWLVMLGSVLWFAVIGLKGRWKT